MPTRINLPENNWIEVDEIDVGIYKVGDCSLFTDWDNTITFSEWDEEVTDLVTDMSECDESYFGYSNHLRWNDVEVTPEIFQAPSLERLKRALQHITITTWNPQDI